MISAVPCCVPPYLTSTFNTYRQIYFLAPHLYPELMGLEVPHIDYPGLISAKSFMPCIKYGFSLLKKNRKAPPARIAEKGCDSNNF